MPRTDEQREADAAKSGGLHRVRKFELGARVKVAAIIDSAGDRRMIGKAGKVVRYVTDDHGATKREPMHIVKFDNGWSDGFWPEELVRE